MRLWNLSEFPVPETSVLETYDPASPQIKRGARPRRPPTRFKIAVGVATLAASFTFGVAQANASSVSLPLSAITVAQSIPEPSPPLARFFRGGFTSDWTEALENELLLKIETGRLEGSAAPIVEQTIDTVFSNQLEDLSNTSSKRMSRDEIAALVKSGNLRR
jgi:hypothetical protein